MDEQSRERYFRDRQHIANIIYSEPMCGIVGNDEMYQLMRLL